HPTEIRTSIFPSSAVELNTTSALAYYATEAAKAFIILYYIILPLHFKMFTIDHKLCHGRPFIDLCPRSCGYSSSSVNSALDLRYQLDGLLRTPLTRALRDSREKLVDAVKLRAAEDKWHPLNLQNKAGLSKFLQEMSDIGIASIHTHVTGACWVGLTGNTVAFSKLYLSLLEDCVRLATPELVFTIDEGPGRRVPRST
ncbi:unnamed protein product, partial [Timema podura]|nr:unnamed protein product [Timema podura]